LALRTSGSDAIPAQILQSVGIIARHVHGTASQAYFLLSELESVRGPFGLPIERDLYFWPQYFKELDP
jgi:hypothetical protein